MNNSKNNKKSGLIPFSRNENGEYIYLMMVSSNPRFGGPDPMISKGENEPFESNIDAAIREAEEELGLKTANLKLHTMFQVCSKKYKRYQLVVFAVEIIDKSNFGKFCYETSHTMWLTAKEFFKVGRADHREIIGTLEQKLVSNDINFST